MRVTALEQICRGPWFLADNRLYSQQLKTYIIKHRMDV